MNINIERIRIFIRKEFRRLPHTSKTAGFLASNNWTVLMLTQYQLYPILLKQTIFLYRSD